MTKLSFVVALAVASRALADCTPTFTEGTPYAVTMSELPNFGWVDNSTSGFFGVNLKSTVPPTGCTDADLTNSDCLYASRNVKVPGSGKIYHSIGCYDGSGELDEDEDFTFTCTSCDSDSGTDCSIKSSVTTECANTPDDALHYPSGEDEEDQIKTAACTTTWYQKWDIKPLSVWAAPFGAP
ncbi:hypothetical protein C8R47DRAFT_1078182 [Mycena vitilis]|nr:hypothetical protein C8R47DRAFT_1078182 [Mycena vitilis]